ncbi:MAG TPA: hypothetical protein VF950_10965 [Planctomycetota bacterium]
MNLLKGLVTGFLLGAAAPYLVCVAMGLLYDIPPVAMVVAVWVLTPPSAIVSSVALGLAGAARDRSEDE